MDAEHRRHAVIELAIRDLKEGAGLRHYPSGVFLANAAWAVIATLAHNLLRLIAAIGLDTAGPVVAKTIRRRLSPLPGRLTRSARQRRLHLPSRWPWATQFEQALTRLRALQAPVGALMCSCSSSVLVEQTAEQVTSEHSTFVPLTDDGQPGWSVRRLKLERPVGTVPVVVLDVDS